MGNSSPGEYIIRTFSQRLMNIFNSGMHLFNLFSDFKENSIENKNTYTSHIKNVILCYPFFLEDFDTKMIIHFSFSHFL